MARHTHYLFDVDGTLTEPRRKMESSFTMSFLSWMEERSVFLVAGSDLDKVNQQVPSSVTKRCSGIFCSMGNEFWSNDLLIYRKEWKASIKLLDRLADIRKKSSYHISAKHLCSSTSPIPWLCLIFLVCTIMSVAK